jgi:predicted phosphoribosyltransferase
VIVTDDGIATGSTMIAALQAVRAQNPQELIVAVPVACPERLEEVRRWCDDVVCLLAPEMFWAVGQFYADFTQVEDEQAVRLLRELAPTSRSREAVACPRTEPEEIEA